MNEICSIVLKGSVVIGSETVPQEAFHTLVLSSLEHETGVSLTAAENETEIVLVGENYVDQPCFVSKNLRR